MRYEKFIVPLCLVLTLAISGCGRKKIEEIGEEELWGPSLVEEKLPATKIHDPLKEVFTAGEQQGPTTPKLEKPKEIVLAEGEILIADFEGWPNNLGGEVGVYGSLEPNWDYVVTTPYSWVYETITPGYNPANVHSGGQSFRLVNGLGSKPNETWGSFAMDLGPTTDLTVIPKRVVSLDVSGYKYLTFWARGEKGGEKMEFLVRDSHALNYNPQIKYKLPDLTGEWQKVAIPLADLGGRVDLTQLDNIGIAFGRDVGNVQGEVAYIDDFIFTNNP